MIALESFDKQVTEEIAELDMREITVKDWKKLQKSRMLSVLNVFRFFSLYFKETELGTQRWCLMNKVMPEGGEELQSVDLFQRKICDPIVKDWLINVCSFI